MRRRSMLATAVVTVGAAAVAVAHAAANGAPAGPPPIANLTATAADHAITLAWSNPAAAYGTGARVIVRSAPGTVAPGSAGVGSEVFVIGGNRATATVLSPQRSYSFGVWVRDGQGRDSLHRTITASTRPDVTAPGPVGDLRFTDPHVTQTGYVTLTWTVPGDTDLAGVRIARNTSSTPAGGDVLTSSPLRTGSFRAVIPDPTHDTWFFVTETDTSGHDSATTSVPVPALSIRTVSGTVNGFRGAVTIYQDGISRPRRIEVDRADFTSTTGTDTPWTVHVPPGHYTVCARSQGAGGAPYHNGCWSPSGTVDDGFAYDPFPAAAARAVDVTAGDVSGLDIVLAEPPPSHAHGGRR